MTDVLKNFVNIKTRDTYIKNILKEVFNRKMGIIFINISLEQDYFYKFRRFFKYEYINLKELSDEALINTLQSVLPSNIQVAFRINYIHPSGFRELPKKTISKIKKKSSKRDKRRAIIMKYITNYPDNSSIDIIRLIEKIEKIKVSFATIKKYKDLVKEEMGKNE